MKIVKIVWLDESIKEAILTLSDGVHEIEAFCHPCRFLVGASMELPLLARDPNELIRVEPQTPYLRKIGDDFEYSVLAFVECARLGLVKVDGILIRVDGRFPEDIVDGQYVQFRTIRVDVQQD